MYSRRAIITLAAGALLGIAIHACSLSGRSVSRRQAQAEDAIAAGDTAQAIDLLTSLQRSRRAGPDVYIRLGQLHRASGTIIGRLHAQEVLEHANSRYPDNANVIFELGKTYYMQTLHPDAARCFERVVRLDPGYCEAYYYLGLNEFRKWMHVQVYVEYMQSARDYLAQTVACDPTLFDGYFKLAFANYILDYPRKTRRQCLDMAAIHPRRADPRFLLGVLAYERQKYAEADSHFVAALALLDEEERDNYLDITLLLPEDEAEDYSIAVESSRRDMRRIFWAGLDLDPTTPINERYLEHIYRVFLADQRYYNARPPRRGWETERGRALIKFGPPSGIASTLGGGLEGRTEIWRYPTGWEFVFKDEFLNGNYMVPIDYSYSFMAQALYLDPPQSAINALAGEVPAFLDVVAFKNESLGSDVHVAMEIDLESVELFVDLVEAGPFVQRAAFFNEDWTLYTSATDTLPGRALAGLRDRGFQWYPIVREYDMPLDFHRVAFCVEDADVTAKALVQTELNTTDYFDNSLVISDILLHRNPPDGGSGARIKRPGGSFYPNPSGVYEHGEKLRLYMEVYNLQTSASSSVYEVTYSIFDARVPGRWTRWRRGVMRAIGFDSPPEPVISQVLPRRGRNHDAYEEIAIDIDSLEPGEYVIRVTVVDRTSGLVAERSRVFTKVPIRFN